MEFRPEWHAKLWRSPNSLWTLTHFIAINALFVAAVTGDCARWLLAKRTNAWVLPQ